MIAMQGLISARAKTSRAAFRTAFTLRKFVPYNNGMERCEQNAQYEVPKDGACVQSKRAGVFRCGLEHPFYGVTFLCHAHAYQAGHKVKNLYEDTELVECVERLFGGKLSV